MIAYDVPLKPQLRTRMIRVIREIVCPSPESVGIQCSVEATYAALTIPR